MAWPFRRVVRAVWWVLVLLVFLVAFPFLVWTFQKEEFSTYYQAWFYAGIFVLMTLPVTFYEVAMHLEYFTSPLLQKFVIRIHWLVPIYAVDAWLSLRFMSAQFYIDPLRECYEAYTIYSFQSYLVAYLESEVGDLERHMALKPSMSHMWGFQLVCNEWQMGKQYLWECKKGILNYVILRPIMAGVSMVSEKLDIYREGHFMPDGMFFWVTMVNNVSQIWAIYCLVMFYRATKKELTPIRPVPKFLLIKAVVFLTFWQSVLISLAISMGWLKTGRWTTYEAKDIGAGLQDFVICIEMFIASLVFAYVFTPKDYMDPSVETRGFFSNVVHMFDVRDVVEDVSSVVEERVDRTTDGLGNVTSNVIHALGSFFKNPRKFFKEKRWRKRFQRHRTGGAGAGADMHAPLLRIYTSVDWSISLPPELEHGNRITQSMPAQLNPSRETFPVMERSCESSDVEGIEIPKREPPS